VPKETDKRTRMQSIFFIDKSLRFFIDWFNIKLMRKFSLFIQRVSNFNGGNIA
jgi:hypothetical protein